MQTENMHAINYIIYFNSLEPKKCVSWFFVSYVASLIFHVLSE